MECKYQITDTLAISVSQNIIYFSLEGTDIIVYHLHENNI